MPETSTHTIGMFPAAGTPRSGDPGVPIATNAENEAIRDALGSFTRRTNQMSIRPVAADGQDYELLLLVIDRDLVTCSEEQMDLLVEVTRRSDDTKLLPIRLDDTDFDDVPHRSQVIYDLIRSRPLGDETIARLGQDRERMSFIRSSTDDADQNIIDLRTTSIHAVVNGIAELLSGTIPVINEANDDSAERGVLTLLERATEVALRSSRRPQPAARLWGIPLSPTVGDATYQMINHCVKRAVEAPLPRVDKRIRESIGLCIEYSDRTQKMIFEGHLRSASLAGVGDYDIFRAIAKPLYDLERDASGRLEAQPKYPPLSTQEIVRIGRSIYAHEEPKLALEGSTGRKFWVDPYSKAHAVGVGIEPALRLAKRWGQYRTSSFYSCYVRSESSTAKGDENPQ